MAGRHLEKFPIVWIGTLIIKNVRTMVKLTYVSGDMQVALDALPRIEPDPTIVLCRRLRMDFTEDFSFQKKKSCVLTAQPYGGTEAEVEKHAANLDIGVVDYLKTKEATGAVGYVTESDKYKLHLYLKSEKTSSILAPLAPDWYHLVCDKVYLVMLIYE